MIISNLKKLLNKYNKKRPKNISIRELARITGVSRSTLMKLVNNQAKAISFHTMNELTKFFNVNTSDLIKYDNGSYLINLDNIHHIPINLDTIAGATANTKERINDSIAISCHDIPGVYFLLIPFLKDNINDTYKVDICCHCSCVSPLSQKAVHMQQLINLFPKKLMEQILYILLTRIVWMNDYSNMATNKSIFYFGNYGPVNNLLNNMIDFSKYKLIAPDGVINYPVSSKIDNHTSIKLNDYDKNLPWLDSEVVKIYNHVQI